MRTAALAILAAAVLGLSPRKLMQFGVEAAQQGLWREALSRWERALKDDATNPRLRSNLAVAYESLGRLEDADAAYREARRLAADSREIRANHESFLEVHPQYKEPESAGGAPTAVPHE